MIHQIQPFTVHSCGQGLSLNCRECLKVEQSGHSRYLQSPWFPFPEANSPALFFRRAL
jgi:hypothetical protein